MIGSLLYLTASIPNICFIFYVRAHYQPDPKDTHLEHVKRIIRYISSTNNYGISFTNDTTYEISGYTDRDWAKNHDNRKSTSSRCLYIGNNSVYCRELVHTNCSNEKFDQ